MLANTHPILSEKPEDQVKSMKWAEEQAKRMKRNKEIGDEVWKRILPVLQEEKRGKK